MEVESLINLYDHDILTIEKVAQALNEKVWTRRNVEAFRREIIGRFEEIGLVVETVIKVPADTPEGGEPDFVSFDVAIVARCEPQPFDHERQAEEVRADILDLTKSGPIKPIT